MIASRPHTQVLRTKLTRPTIPDGMVARPRLLRRIDPAARVALVVAPPGFGKTTLVAQWAQLCPDPLAWISLDLLDETPEVFWAHVIEAVRAVVPFVDDAPRLALTADPSGWRFLHLLIGELEGLDRRVVVVLDSLSTLPDRRTADGLALLAERVGDRLQLVVTARVDPVLPLVRWRTQGWLAEIRERDLRLSDEEALRVAATFSGLGLPDDVYLGLNRRADGWPIAFHLALVSAQEAAEPEDGLRAMARSDRELSDYVVAEILDRLPPDLRDAVLDLSAADWFDPALAVELAGASAGAVVGELRRRRLLITDVPGRPDEMRFHPLFRELLDAELRWRDPDRHRAAHRRVADAMRRRQAGGDSVTVASVADASLQLAERLTSREQTILELLPTHLSYGQIADELYLSVNTVKSNLKAVYRKLGVNTRSDAVFAGRSAGLL
jgi:LuxR family maltose regulon positive regulatory protein